ncbi:MAG TPA: lysophospholipid acyltransferase family protein [bacterium]|mgnify:FL=1|nr:MAG: Phosphatidylinositol mannoside acyltransferase [bacterium ADurb.Bin236]HOY63977.1 lysophospholipid acyltransferase family protein [bacterium]HPI75350.1 lysophospholipid acyltransferase family protein [bacterium]HPN93785.1 lysophospholipid acyltransferase family protein [bacterium]
MKLTHILIGIVSVLLRVLPSRAQESLADFFGSLFVRVYPRSMNLMLSNLRRAFKDEYSDDELREIAKRSIQNLIKSMFEFLRFPVYDEKALERMVSIEGTEHLAAALKAGKGAVVISSHYGNWELLAWKLAVCGYPLTAVGREQDDGVINDMIVKLRTSKGTKHIPRGVPMFQHITELLAANQCVGLVSDQNAGTRGIFVDFFGSKVSAFKGPGLFAVRCGCPVIPLFIVREGYEKHHAVIFPEVVIKKTGDAGKDIAAYCQGYTSAIEEFVRRHPDHWFWIHKRWKTRPPGEEEPGGTNNGVISNREIDE